MSGWKDDTSDAERTAAKARERVSPHRRDELTRVAIFEAAAGVGKQRIGAFPLLVDRPGNVPDSVPWEPARYTLRMILSAYPSARRILSEADMRSMESILRTRVQEIHDERSGATARKKRSWLRKERAAKEEREGEGA